MTEVFRYYSSSTAPRGILSIPHSGLLIPPEFANFLVEDRQILNQDVDFAVDQLVDIPLLQQNGVHVLVANIHRTAVDLNRASDICVLNWPQNTHGIPLVLQSPSAEQIEYLRLKYYSPYYELMTSLIKDMEKRVELVSFVDLHSMPSTPTAYHMKQNPNQEQTRPDYCLSDQYGKTCRPEFIHAIQQYFEKMGFSTKINTPYIGGNITKYVDQFKTNNIQIEINRAIYMDEQHIKLKDEATVTAKRKVITNGLIELFDQFYKPIQVD